MCGRRPLDNHSGGHVPARVTRRRRGPAPAPVVVHRRPVQRRAFSFLLAPCVGVIDNAGAVVIYSNMARAELLLEDRYVLSPGAFAEILVWRVPKPLPGSAHRFKYRLAFVLDGKCVLRYDNETGKGDHRHVKGHEMPYRFVGLDELQADFWRDIDEWSPPWRP
jgi:hypothetical protein